MPTLESRAGSRKPRHPGILDQLLRSGTGMYLMRWTLEAIEKETKLDPKFSRH